MSDRVIVVMTEAQAQEVENLLELSTDDRHYPAVRRELEGALKSVSAALNTDRVDTADLVTVERNRIIGLIRERAEEAEQEVIRSKQAFLQLPAAQINYRAVERRNTLSALLTELEGASNE